MTGELLHKNMMAASSIKIHILYEAGCSDILFAGTKVKKEISVNVFSDKVYYPLFLSNHTTKSGDPRIWPALSQINTTGGWKGIWHTEMKSSALCCTLPDPTIRLSVLVTGTMSKQCCYDQIWCFNMMYFKITFIYLFTTDTAVTGHSQGLLSLATMLGTHFTQLCDETQSSSASLFSYSVLNEDLTISQVYTRPKLGIKQHPPLHSAAFICTLTRHNRKCVSNNGHALFIAWPLNNVCTFAASETKTILWVKFYTGPALV